ncbi:MAG: alpha/beta fold hydrolase [Arenicella sp.]
MTSIIANGIQLEYKIYGKQNSNILLMIQGLSMQLIDWPTGLIKELAKDYQVIVFDNRDIGLSDKINNCSNFNNLDRRIGFFDQDIHYASYTLYDMASDSIGLIDALGINKFHVLGFSMGGMIAQIIAAKKTNRVLSLISISSSGGQEEIKPSIDAKLAMEQSGVNVPLELAIQNSLEALSIYNGSKYTLDKSTSRLEIIKSIQRQYYPQGIYRQGLAMRASGNRKDLLKKISAPTLIIHGTDDTCIPLNQAKQAVELINDAKLCAIDGLGHDFPESLLPYLSKIIRNHCRTYSQI